MKLLLGPSTHERANVGPELQGSIEQLSCRSLGVIRRRASEQVTTWRPTTFSPIAILSRLPLLPQPAPFGQSTLDCLRASVCRTT